MLIVYIVFSLILVAILSVVVYKTFKAVKEAELWNTKSFLINGFSIQVQYERKHDTPILLNAIGTALQCLAEVYSPSDMKATLDGVTVLVSPTNTWIQVNTGIQVGGESYLNLKLVKVDTNLTSLAHEFAHIIEGGVNRIQVNESHGDWPSRGVFAAIDKYQSLLKKG